ncbi:MAG: protein phosphatase 2C domain-containing protein [bacterium]
MNEQSVLGVFPGKGKNSKPHKHINEDMIAQVKTVNNEIISMVADGHNGKDTAETLVTEFPEIIKDTLGRRNDISRDLFISLILLNSKILSEKHLKNMFIPQDLSASTFLTTIQKNDKLYYISVGDSYMYLIDKE